MIIKTRDSQLADWIAMVVICLMAVGTVFIFSAGANLGQQLNIRRFYDFPSLRQLLFFPLAVSIMYTVSCINYRRLSADKGWLKSPAGYLLVISLTLLVLVLIFGTEINQSRRWLRMHAGPAIISFQPSELAKWAIVLFLAAYGDKYKAELNLYRRRFVPACAVVALTAGLIISEDFGTAAFILLIGLLILITAGARLRHIATLLPFAVIGFCGVLLRSPGRLLRIAAFFNPKKWADSAAYQANQSLIALGSGGMFGKGLGGGICKYGHLPEDTTDFIFAIIGEELGFVGTAAVIGLFVVFVWVGILVVVRCRDSFGRLLAGGIVLAIGIQAVINIGVVTVVLPTKGIPLPFVSSGGTSMLLSAAAVGILMNVAKQSYKGALEADE